MRSKLVHGKVDSTSLGAFTIQGRRYEYLDTAQELERITRLSILKFLNFLSDKITSLMKT
jgi:hypothetical protein